MYYYKYKEKLLFSQEPVENLEQANEESFEDKKKTIYYLKSMNPFSSRRGYALTSSGQISSNEEGICLLEESIDKPDLPAWLHNAIEEKRVKAINISFPKWKQELDPLPAHWKVNVVALGDVGSTLLIGLRLLGSNMSIGIYDRTLNKMKRWEHELNQIRRPFDEFSFPPVRILEEDELFDCDMFVFCASKGIPPVGEENVDVRMVQLEGNRQILGRYAKMSRDLDYRGIFAVVSDPVDLLCRGLYIDSNTDASGNLDFMGLAPNQIIGYGLGVMNARAVFHAERSPHLSDFLKEGQVFGPHGKGLIVADSMKDYNEENSLELTEKTLVSNLDIRKFGFKPYVAPSLSSGALSLIATIRGEYFYGSSMMGEVFMGSKMRLGENGIEVPFYKLHPDLKKRLENTYNELRSLI